MVLSLKGPYKPKAIKTEIEKWKRNNAELEPLKTVKGKAWKVVFPEGNIMIVLEENTCIGFEDNGLNKNWYRDTNSNSSFPCDGYLENVGLNCWSVVELIAA